MRSVFANPYLQLAFSSVLVAASEFLLKLGAAETALTPHAFAWTGLHGLASQWVWAGIALLILSFLSWIYVLRKLPLNVAYPLANVVHVLVPIGSWIFLGEAIGAIRWGGIALVILGLIIVAEPLGRIEGKLG